MKTEENFKNPDYRSYRLLPVDRIKYGSIGALSVITISVLFYRSIMMAAILAVPAAFLLPVLMKEELRKKRKVRLSSQFREAIGIVGGYISAGYSVENAFGASASQLAGLFGNEADITREFLIIRNGVSINRPIEELLDDFAKRSDTDEIKSFAEVFSIASRTGGSLTDITERAVSVIREKMEVSEEIRNITASKRFEQKIMLTIPFFLILYLDVTNPGYLDPMYETVAGRVIMTGCLLLMSASWFVSGKILDIKI
ncbi:MAG: type II secretion system F family protein [Lachnospiraceae bacterium]|nr:type II secretion system F family protein [Lachnospiraceae bacterium]